MATGLEMYDAVHDATRRFQPGSAFTINTLDSTDLRKLTIDDLLSRHYGESVAEEVSSALFNGDFKPFARSLGIRLVLSDDAPPLLSHT